MVNQRDIKNNLSSLAYFAKLFDICAINFALFFACYFLEQTYRMELTFLAIFSTLEVLLVAEWADLYRPWRFNRITPENLRVGLIWLGTWLFTTAFAPLAALPLHVDDPLALIWLITALVLLIGWRTCLRFSMHWLRKRGVNNKTVAIVGAGHLGVLLAKKLTDSPWMGIKLLGFFDDQFDKNKHSSSRFSEQGSMEITGSPDDLIDLAKAGKVEVVYITLPMRAEKRILELLDGLSDSTASVHVVPDLFIFDMLHSRWVNVEGIPTAEVLESPYAGIAGGLKRAEDLLVSTLALAVVLIPMFIIALAVKLTSKGPVIFKQHRYGADGRRIKVYKFRTMQTTENGQQVIQATRNDARITPLGAFLRRTSLDELPQFYNVLQGRMSVVGPRPHAIAHNEYYRKLIPKYMLRHKVKPGITGWAQINGWRGETDTLEKMSKRVEHDLDYIRNWSLWLDLKIIIQTVFKGFTGRNAY